MKFSYTLLRKFVPKLPAKEVFIEKFSLHAFETADLPAGQVGAGSDALEISIPANRYSDSGSHLGIAKLAAAVFNTPFKGPAMKEPKVELKNTKPAIKISAKKLCSRYLGRYFEISRTVQSPQWLKEALTSSGLRSINAVVDVMNYVMLETGQPLHAFDAELISGGIDVRLAKPAEEIRTLEGVDYKLSSSDLVIADEKGPLAIAGIKGGKRAEINIHTKKIIVEVANFDSVGIYKTARQLNLFTDASSRFSHGLSPVAAEIAMKRATILLKDLAGAKVGELTDVNFAKISKNILKFDIKRFNQLIGLDLNEKSALEYLKRLGFGVKGKYVEVPPMRTDVTMMEDLAEEIVNLNGYDKLPSIAPHVPLTPAKKEDQVVLKEGIREILRGFGLSEVYNYSFVSRKDLTKYADPKWWGAVALLNPISADFHYLRPGLSIHLLRNVEDNFRFYDQVRIFEIGKTFAERKGKLEEELMLGIAIGMKKENPIMELKGLADELFKQVGLTDYFFRDLDMDVKFLEAENSLRMESDHHVIGYIGLPKGESATAIAEIYLDRLLQLVEEEKEYEPISKYPAVMRDISIFVPREVRVNSILEDIQNTSPVLLSDVDLIDFYEDPNLKEDRKSLTFRLVFQADDRTLTDDEVGIEMAKIIQVLEEKFDAEVR